MANYTGVGRTNYVLLRDEQAYYDFEVLVELLGGTTHERTNEQGQCEIAAFGNAEDGDFKSTVNIEELLDAGYVSRHDESPLDATRAEYTELGEEANDKEVASDLLHEVYPMLAAGQVLVLQCVGNEKQRYVSGYAAAISSDGDQVSLALDDIYALAEKTFGKQVSRASS